MKNECIKEELDKNVLEALGKLDKISDELKDRYVERDFVIDNCIKALITGQTVLMVGPPGTAKSAITDDLCKRIDGGKYFSWLLNRTSDPSEILGPFSLKEMENDKFLRVTKNKLPEAEIVFLDEIFKCNEPTLNILLPLINEKVFYNDGTSCDVPLITLFAASNEYPDEDSLMALYDRLMFRLELNYVQDSTNKLKMYKSFLEGSGQKCSSISLDEIKLIKSEMDTITISDEVLTEYIKLITKIYSEGIIISDRRQNEALKVLRATALLNRRTSVEVTDFISLKSVFWNLPDEIELLSDILKEFTLSPLTKTYNNLRNRFNSINSSSKSVADPGLLYELKESALIIGAQVSKILSSGNDMDKDLLLKYKSLKSDISSFDEKISGEFDEDDVMMMTS